MNISSTLLEQALAETDVMHCCVCEENKSLDEYRGEALQIAHLVEQGKSFDVAIKTIFNKYFDVDLSSKQMNQIIQAYQQLEKAASYKE